MTSPGQLLPQNIATAEERPQRLGYPYLAVGLLVVLQDRDQPAGGRQGSVKCRGDLGLAVLVAVPDGQPPGLEGGAVGGGGDLAVAALRRYPRLAVVLAGRAAAEVAGRHVDHPVRDLHLGEHLLLDREQAQMLVVRLLRPAVREHLHLVELVYPEDPAHVLAVAARLPPEARGPPSVPARPVEVEDLPGVVRGEGNLGRTDEIHVVGLEAADLRRVGAEETRTLPGFGLDPP